MDEYIFVKIPSLTFFYHHDFINGGHKSINSNILTPNFNYNTNVRTLRSQYLITMDQNIWTPNIEPDNLSDILARNIANEIDQQILQDIHNNHRFYQQNNLNEALNRWNRLIEPMVRNARTPRDIEIPGINDYPLAEDCVTHYMVLPNEEGWYGNGTFDSIFIKMDMRPYNFLKRRRSRRI